MKRDDPATLARSLAPVVREYVSRAMQPMLERIAALEARPIPVGINSSVVDREGCFILTLSDGKTNNLGCIQGKDGRDGRDGEPGKNSDPEEVALKVLDLLPVPEPGAPGRDGKDADIEVVRQMVVEAMEKIPAPAAGQPGPQGSPGEPGLDGKDADPEEIARMVLERLPPPERGAPGKDGRAITELKRIGDELMIAMTDGTTFSTGVIRGERGDAGPPGPAGEAGRAGTDVDPTVIAQMVAAEVNQAISSLPSPERGEPGPPGRDGEGGDPGEKGERGDPGQDADPDAVAELVLARIPVPEDGKDGAPGKDVDPEMVAFLVAEQVQKAVAALPEPEPGPQGPPGPVGEIGPKGDPGPIGDRGENGNPGESIKGDPGPAGKDGLDGIGMADAFIDRDGTLVLTRTDGTTRNLGLIVGRDGAPGAPGKDGLSFDSFTLEPEFDGERTLRLKWTDASGKEHAREWRLPIVIDRGVFKEGLEYRQGDGVTYGGSFWIAQKDAAEGKPDNGNGCWRLAVKRGRDGKDGEKGERGPEGKTVKSGSK